MTALKARKLPLAAVFPLAFLALSVNLWRTSIGSGWIDPVLHYGAQDEATYTHEAIHMATQGGWMTPMLLGRWIFEKPPLLVWLSAASMKLLGINSFTARLPALLAGALIATLCFAIARAARSTIAGVAAALLCVSNQLLFIMSRHNMTDILLTAAMVAVVAVLVFDPSLSRRTSRVTFVLAIAAGILTKSIAGLLPAFAALLFAALAGTARTTRLRATILLTGLAILLASPWFLYHMIVHGNWFFADLGFQIVTIGLKPRQTSPENHVAFYLARYFYAAPVTLVLGITGIPALITALRRRDAVPLLLASFLAVLSVALLMFRFHSEQYLTPLLPVVILIATISSPLSGKPFAAPLAAAIAIVFFIKAANPDRTWGISYRPGSTIVAARTLSQYCEERRGNDLYILGVDDEFYGLVLPLPHVRYGWLDPDGAMSAVRPHLVYLGIVQEATARPNTALYASRLRAWGLGSTAPLFTGISARSGDDFAALVLAHPESDFLIPPGIARRLPRRESHEIRFTGPDYVLLESRTPQITGAPGWSCWM